MIVLHSSSRPAPDLHRTFLHGTFLHGTGRALAIGALACALALGCAGPRAPTPEGPLLEPLGLQSARLPTHVDEAALRLAAASLVGSHDDAAAALREFESILDADQQRRGEQRDSRQLLASERPGESLRPFAIDVANAALPRASEYRQAAKKILQRGDLNPAHRTRLEEAAADDPLALARARIRDHRESIWAQTFNAASRPLGRTVISGLALAPYALAQSIVHYLASMNERPAISVQERQALAHWKRYLAMEADAPDADTVRSKIASAEAKLNRHFAEQYTAAARASLELDRVRRALVLSERALAHRPGDRSASRISAEATRLLAVEEEGRARSLAAPVALETAASAERSLALASLVELDPEADLGLASEMRPGEAVIRSARRAARGEERRLRELADFSTATIQAERGHTGASFARLDRLARLDPEDSSVSRHAAALVVDPFQNPYGHWQHASARANGQIAAFRLLGPWSRAPRYPSLPRSVSYLIDAPAVAQAVITAPLRILLENWEPQADFRRPAALAAYRSLARDPAGEHRRELLEWLYDYESDRKHLSAALRIADHIPGFDPERRRELAEAVADERLLTAASVDRPDLRGELLRSVVRDFPETQAGRDAGIAAREEALDRSPQRIRLTRGFLEENAPVAGPLGLGLRAELLDGRLDNGELHPEGVTFRGGRKLEIALLAESGEEEDEPVMRSVRLSAERLSRSVAQLEEAAILGAQIDRDDEHGPDARRDQFFERARLGLTDRSDERAAARSTYVYRGLRERYGLVRGRDSILPFDLVLSGSLIDLSLGAYPRWREPELTPDAFLYR